MASFSIVPFEIVTSILDFCDFQDIKAVSLVSRHFRDVAFTLLFRGIEISSSSIEMMWKYHELRNTIKSITLLTQQPIIYEASLYKSRYETRKPMFQKLYDVIPLYENLRSFSMSAIETTLEFTLLSNILQGLNSHKNSKLRSLSLEFGRSESLHPLIIHKKSEMNATLEQYQLKFPLGLQNIKLSFKFFVSMNVTCEKLLAAVLTPSLNSIQKIDIEYGQSYRNSSMRFYPDDFYIPLISTDSLKSLTYWTYVGSWERGRTNRTKEITLTDICKMWPRLEYLELIYVGNFGTRLSLDKLKIVSTMKHLKTFKFNYSSLLTHEYYTIPAPNKVTEITTRFLRGLSESSLQRIHMFYKTGITTWVDYKYKIGEDGVLDGPRVNSFEVDMKTLRNRDMGKKYDDEYERTI